MYFFTRKKAQEKTINEKSQLINGENVSINSFAELSTNQHLVNAIHGINEDISKEDGIKYLSEFSGISAPIDLSNKQATQKFHQEVIKKFLRVMCDGENFSVPIAQVANIVMSTLPQVSRSTRLISTTGLGLGLFMLQVAFSTLEEIYGEEANDVVKKILHIAEASPEVAEIFGYMFALECKLISYFFSNSLKFTPELITGITIMAGVDIGIALFLYHQRMAKAEFNNNKSLLRNISWLSTLCTALIGLITVSGIAENSERIEQYSVDKNHFNRDSEFWDHATLFTCVLGFSIYLIAPLCKQISISRQGFDKQVAEETMQEFKQRWLQREQGFNFLMNLEYDIGTLIQAIHFEEKVPIILIGAKMVPLLGLLGVEIKRGCNKTNAQNDEKIEKKEVLKL